MVHRAGTTAQVQHGPEGTGNIGLGLLHSGVQVAALGQVGGNGAGEGTAGAMGVGVADPPAMKPLACAVSEKVVGVADLVAALAENRAAVAFADGSGSSLHAGGIGNGHAGENLRLWNVGGQDSGQGQQALF